MSPHQRPFRFSVQASSASADTDWRELARKLEDLGYATLTAADHFDRQFAPVPALMAAADATTTLRIGSLVFCNDYRHPVLAAKEAATLDVLSGGRFELGMGAGWMTADYEAAGIPLDRPSVRIARLAESLEIVTGLLGGETVNFTGEHYSITNLVGTPSPAQSPRPPLLVAGGGRKVLTLAGATADIVGLNPGLAAGVIDGRAGPTATAAATDDKLSWIRAAAGDRFDELEIQTRIHVAMIHHDRPALAESLAPVLGISPAEAMESPHALAGSVDECVESLLAWRERWGISYIGLSLDAAEQMAPVVAKLANT
jgi:probable F420-dependent oxidoreductase